MRKYCFSFLVDRASFPHGNDDSTNMDFWILYVQAILHLDLHQLVHECLFPDGHEWWPVSCGVPSCEVHELPQSHRGSSRVRLCLVPIAHGDAAHRPLCDDFTRSMWHALHHRLAGRTTAYCRKSFYMVCLHAWVRHTGRPHHSLLCAGYNATEDCGAQSEVKGEEKIS